MAERSPAAEAEHQRDRARDNATVEFSATNAGPTIERSVRVNATANSKGIVQDSTVSVRITVPLDYNKGRAQDIVENELWSLQSIANDHLKRRVEQLRSAGYDEH